jgi:hypothetical protein
MVICGLAEVAAWTKATCPIKALHPVWTLSVQGASPGNCRRVTHNSPDRSGSKASAVALQPFGGSYNETSETAVGKLPAPALPPVPLEPPLLFEPPLAASPEASGSEPQAANARPHATIAQARHGECTPEAWDASGPV